MFLEDNSELAVVHLENMASLALLVCLAVLSQTFASGQVKGHWFCHDLDCPKYTLVAKKNDYEIRNYDESKWVGTTIASMSYTMAAMRAFWPLFHYISGANNDKVNIPMAAPVATKIVPGQGPACKTNFTVMFFTPFAFDANTPEPTNPELSIINIPAFTAYVTSFGGFMTDDVLQQRTAELVAQLKKEKIKFVSDYYYAAGYDPPFRITDRHNEVWIVSM